MPNELITFDELARDTAEIVEKVCKEQGIPSDKFWQALYLASLEQNQMVAH